ncbi:uncharacterized protein LOC111709821 [Eurytemora carolleeae]|uniref:uncharacterized protein LOC111709821 n=1 Tax=Eurytemora carolleeae TaxID=1294199 RepID=UPI000C77F78B|nr:uncharacterized protein LOC111709821 [Eurytemora carolleeae]|eukprot:XP_023339505.1 uncharacterized protein LOC111709821 [Eurytemora affinis]
MRIFTASILLIIIPQLVNIYLAGKVTSEIRKGITEQYDKMDTHIVTAIQANDWKKMQDFDKIQVDFHCCGINSQPGFDYWNKFAFDSVNVTYVKKNSLPEACCINCGPTCSCDAEDFFLLKRDDQRKKQVYRIGCLYMIEMVYKKELEAVLDVGYIISALLCSGLEIGAAVLSIYYIKIIKKF